MLPSGRIPLKNDAASREENAPGRRGRLREIECDVRF